MENKIVNALHHKDCNLSNIKNKNIAKDIIRIASKLNIPIVKNFILTEIPKNRDYIGSLGICLTDHCDLNCAYCDHFASLAKPRFETLNNYEKLISKLSELFPDKIQIFGLIGGEPLLHPELLDFARIYRKYFTIGYLVITTNGIILQDKDKHFYEELKHTNTSIIVSNYNLSNIDYEKIMKHCYDNNVSLTLRDKTYMNHMSLDINTTNNSRYKNCGFSGVINNKSYSYPCTQICSNGDFYFCAVPANINHLNKYYNINFKVDANDKYNIYEENAREKILYGLEHEMPFCKYCVNNSDNKKIWKKSEKNIDEWLL